MLAEIKQKSMKIKIAEIPLFKKSSPKIVLTYDKMRFELEKVDAEKHAEFYWYAREFPRYFRYHFDNIEYRLTKIHKLYSFHLEDFKSKYDSKRDENCYEMTISNPYTFQVYWEFEALLNAISTALDILARISGLEFIDQTPVSLNNLAKKKDLFGVVEILRNAKLDWIDEMKNLRDCFVHYSPVDSRPYLTFYRTETMWKIWGKLPTNPNIRVADAFEFSKNLDLLKYSIKLYEKLNILDNDISIYIENLYEGHFPKRIENLFFIGRRM
jgi:hypothetical protein